MNNIDKQYQVLLQTILDYGVEKKDRTGIGTKSIFGYTIRHKMSEGFPLLTTKKMHWKSIVTELLWFLRGETNIKFLLDYDCHIWDGDAYKRYERANTWELQDTPPISEFIKRIKEDETFRKTWGELGPIYGAQWRNWRKNKWDKIDMETHIEYIDQIDELVRNIKTNPDSRRLMVSAWNVGELNQMVLPPCHYGFQVYTRDVTYEERKLYWIRTSHEQEMWVKMKWEKENILKDMKEKNTPTKAIFLMWNQRSVDTFLGLPFNIASYGLLLMIIAKEVNMIPDELIGNLGDTHLYLNHIEQAKEQITRTPYSLPKVIITERNWYLHENVKKHVGEKNFNEKILSYRPDCFELLNYSSHPKIKAPLNN